MLVDSDCSDTTEQEIVDWLAAVCHLLGELVSPDLEITCNLVLGAQIPNIINDLVNNNLNPRQVCQRLGACKTIVSVISNVN